MKKMLNSAIICATRWLGDNDFSNKKLVKGLLRRYADKSECFENIVFEAGLEEVAKCLKRSIRK